MVIKPASLTPLTILKLADILAEAGLPDGVLNVVTTTSTGKVMGPLIADGRIRKLSFTGSTEVGQKLIEQSAQQVLKTSMELGGNAPFVVCADADVDEAVQGAMLAKMRNIGEACTAANRFYIHAGIVDEFTTRFGAAVEALTVGAAADGAEIGPLISGHAVESLDALVRQAIAAGARISHRAPVPDSKGWFYPPTVLADVPADADILDAEIFGPVAPIVAWHDDTELLKLVNASQMGLAAYVYAGELQRAMRLGEAFDAGMVGVNRGVVSDPSAPFGGVKQSGLGREGARAGLEEFQETQYLSIDWPVHETSVPTRLVG